jgi:hypothetical protein
LLDGCIIKVDIPAKVYRLGYILDTWRNISTTSQIAALMRVIDEVAALMKVIDEVAALMKVIDEVIVPTWGLTPGCNPCRIGYLAWITLFAVRVGGGRPIAGEAGLYSTIFVLLLGKKVKFSIGLGGR